jgi:adenylylsulfate kinase-like enzyme
MVNLQSLLEKLLGSSWQSERSKRPSTDKLASLLKDAGLIDLIPHLSPGERRDLIRILTHRDPVLWMEHNFIIPEPRDPVLGTVINDEGPIRVAPYQADVVRECLRRKPDGHFVYSTILWSEVKKSGKTTLAAAIETWLAATTKNAECYCVANDGKQSKDRIYAKIRRAAELSKKLNYGALAKASVTRDRMTFSNGSYIEAIACDPSGEAGGEPTITVFSELHGMRQEHKRRLWAEMTIPPTRWGRAIRWAESYAGYQGEDSILEQLYENIVENGERHPDFPDLPVYVKGSNIAFWSHTGRQAWHTQEYYAAEADALMPNEFRRMHQNEWVSTEEQFVPLEWWRACVGEVPPIGDAPLIVIADAAVSGDTFAVLAVSRQRAAR